MSFLNLNNVDVSYNNIFAIKDVTLEIHKGEIISILGPNGSGKSTLLKAILNLLKFEGNITLNDNPINRQLNLLSYMPQSEEIDKSFPISVREVVEQSQYRRKNLYSKKLVDDAISLNDLSLLENKSLSELSGGQLQRTFLSRALAQNGELILLDEPFSNMDINTQNKVINILIKMKEKGTTILITTHNLKLAQKISTRILLLNKKVICFEPPASIYEKEHIIQTFGEDAILVSGNLSLSDHHSH